MISHVILPALFQRYKTTRISYLVSFSAAMARRRRLLHSTHDEQARPRAPVLDPCIYVEVVSPAFDPNRVFIRRVFFLNDENS